MGKLNRDLTKLESDNTIIDELMNNVGASAFNLIHDRFYGGLDMKIHTAAGFGGTKLIEDTDYTLGGLDTDLSARAVSDVYSTITVINATYQTGNLYFSYQVCADLVDALDRYTIIPPTIFSINDKAGITPIGGYAIKLTNKTVDASVEGDIVIASTGTADAVAWAGGDELQPIGVFLDTGVADGSEAWIVVSGIAEVHMDAAGCALGDRILTSGTARRGEASNSPSAAEHYREIGHAIEVIGANATGKVVLHFL